MLTPPAEPLRYHMLINGQWVEAASGRRYRRESPAHDVAVGDYPLASVIDTDAAVAAARGVPKAQVALAWVAQKPVVTSPIVGASKPQHLNDAAAELTLNLTESEIGQLEAPYVPHAVAGHS